MLDNGSLKNIIFYILKQSTTPLKVKEITKLALKQSVRKSFGKTPNSTISGIISLDIKMNKEKILLEIKDRLAAVYGTRLVEVILYGSVARGEEHDDSDIDVLVLLKGPMNLGDDLMTNIETLSSFGRDLGHMISPKPVDVEQYESFDCPLFRVVRKEGITAGSTGLHDDAN